MAITNEELQGLISEAKEALKYKRLFMTASGIEDNRTHLLYTILENNRKYPCLPFRIEEGDLKELSDIRKFPDPEQEPDIKDWSPWKKMLYALLWKDNKLKSIRRIIDGIESAINGTSVPLLDDDRNVVYYYFGRHLTNPLNEPLVDQHTIRAHRLIMVTPETPEEVVSIIRGEESPTAKQAREYRDWFREILKNEDITTYENARKIDSYLLALGTTAKLRA